MGEGLDSADVTRLYAKYGFFVRRRCTLLLRDRALADDATHLDWIKAVAAGCTWVTSVCTGAILLNSDDNLPVNFIHSRTLSGLFYNVNENLPL